MQSPREFNAARIRWSFIGGSLLILTCGCHDGPMYGLKTLNPYFSMKQWKEDEKYGVTDFTRRQELTKLVAALPDLPMERQAFWLRNLQQIMEHDESPEMRRLAVMAAGQLTLPDADEIVREGMKDENNKVRMACCQVLGNRSDTEATRMLAEVAGSTSNQDVRRSALAALGKHQGPVATDALRIALDDRDPATRGIVMKSLRSNVGKNYGNDPEVWIAALEGKPSEVQPASFTERVKDLIR